MFGDTNGDYVPGGVDFAPELYVGRIPVYMSNDGWSATLDSILRKTIAYEISDREWRRSALLTMAFLDTGSDGAKLGEDMEGGLFGRRRFHNASDVLARRFEQYDLP
ncbi:MAG: C25 family cysteine peptidase [Caldilineaceae bacterium]